MPSLLAPLVVVHVALALALLLPAVLLPLALRGGSPEPATAGPLARGLVALQSRGVAPVGLGLLASGIGLIAVLGVELLGRPWLLVALAIYAANLSIAWFIQRPALRRLVGGSGRPDGERAWQALARRLRWVSYAMAGMVGVIGLLMSSKPDLW